MTKRRPTTIAEYLDSASDVGRPHLLELYSLLKDAAPLTEEATKWGQPFLIGPRFLFALSALKAHAGFIVTTTALEPFRDALKGYEITRRWMYAGVATRVIS